MKPVVPLLALCAGAALVVTTGLSAQDPRRPKLDAKADTNDWESYYDYGVRTLQQSPPHSYAAFSWAARLAPWSADPLYAQWVAFHMRDIPRFRKYLEDDLKTRNAPDVRRADSLLAVAYLRNPFVHRALEMALFDALPGSWGGDTFTRAWIAYANQKLDRATELFGRAIDDKPDRYYRYRHIRAVLFVAAKQYDSALTQMTALLDKARQIDEKELVRAYESKAFYEYAIARLEMARGNRAGAQEALERALVEDLTYGPAHLWLGALAETRSDTAKAFASYAQAVDLAPEDAVYHYQYGVALLKAARAKEAVEQFDRAIALEPYYADSYVFKASAHELLGQTDLARFAYHGYLARAARNAPNRSLATRRLAALDGAAR